MDTGETVIYSTAGKQCRIRWEQLEIPAVISNGEKIPVRRDGRNIIFQTEPGTRYTGFAP